MIAAITAIIHLREPCMSPARLAIEPSLRAIRGVDHMQFDSADGLIAVDFDATQTTIAEIVRAIEDSGTIVTGVAQRQHALRQAV